VVQQAPGEMPKPATTRVIPPMTAPQAPSWKQQDQQHGSAGEPVANPPAPASETNPAAEPGNNAPDNKESGE
jgi:hypothetical protein